MKRPLPDVGGLGIGKKGSRLLHALPKPVLHCVDPTTRHGMQARADDEGNKEYGGGGSHDAVNAAKEDLHCGRVAEEALGSGPLDLGAGLEEEAELDGRGEPGEEAGGVRLKHSIEGGAYAKTIPSAYRTHCNRDSGDCSSSRSTIMTKASGINRVGEYSTKYTNGKDWICWKICRIFADSTLTTTRANRIGGREGMEERSDMTARAS